MSYRERLGLSFLRIRFGNALYLLRRIPLKSASLSGWLLIDENSEIDYEIKEVLECASEILKGKSGSISYLSYLMDKC